MVEELTQRVPHEMVTRREEQALIQAIHYKRPGYESREEHENNTQLHMLKLIHQQVSSNAVLQVRFKWFSLLLVTVSFHKQGRAILRVKKVSCFLSIRITWDG